jgi:hypothetical protein
MGLLLLGEQVDWRGWRLVLRLESAWALRICINDFFHCLVFKELGL